MRRTVLAFAVAALGACSTPSIQLAGESMEYDKDTRYSVTERAGGFVVTVEYSSYQFFPSLDVVANTCRDTVTAIAYEVSEKRGKKIKVDPQRTRVAAGRNGVFGITSCGGSAVAEYL